MVVRAALSGAVALSLAVGAQAQDQAAARDISRTGGDLIGYRSIHHPVIGRDGMVVAQSRTAARIGADILARGGNAVDAAVAVGLAETMTLPRAGNIGGGGYMLVYDAASKATVAIEYYGQAPLGVTPDFLLGPDQKLSEAKVMSFKGVTVPGTVATRRTGASVACLGPSSFSRPSTWP
jgi:gamma-glutamyltranspeptidase/glutathione hydrolase